MFRLTCQRNASKRSQRFGSRDFELLLKAAATGMFGHVARLAFQGGGGSDKILISETITRSNASPECRFNMSYTGKAQVLFSPRAASRGGRYTGNLSVLFFYK
jgi:hypothetical protein